VIISPDPALIFKALFDFMGKRILDRIEQIIIHHNRILKDLLVTDGRMEVVNMESLYLDNNQEMCNTVLELFVFELKG